MADRAACIKARNLSFSAKGARVLSVPELAIPCDGITVILGPNGAGKSVLLRILHGILPPDTGAVAYPGHTRAPRQAMVFQRPVLLRRTVAANIRFALAASGKTGSPVDPYLERAGLAAKANQPARTLSGGEQQKLAMARALATMPELLFLDEPTANLDPAATLAIEAMVREAAQSGTKIIMVTHDVAQARRLADDILFCHAGAIAETTPAPAFFDAPESPEAARFLDGVLAP